MFGVSLCAVQQLREAPAHGVARALPIHQQDIAAVRGHGKVVMMTGHRMPSEVLPGWQCGLVAPHLQTMLVPCQLRAEWLICGYAN